MSNEVYKFPGGVCSSCGHTPLIVEYATNNSGWHNLRWKCPECGASEFLPRESDRDLRDDPVMRKWAEKVKQRDGCCVICGNVSELDAHHIIPVAKQPKLRYKLTNGITLCRRCHKLAHDGVGWPEKYK